MYNSFIKFTILSWNKSVFFKNNYTSCPVFKCEIIFNHRKSFDVDAILFEEEYITNKHRTKFILPRRKNNKVLNVYTSIQSPIPASKNGFKRNYKLPVDYFNLIFSYNSFSDIIFNYGGPWILNEKLSKKPFNREDKDIFKYKDTPIIWINKNCKKTKGQNYIINNLKSKIKLEQFERCNDTLEINKTFTKKIYEKYYFYVVMDEAECQEYLTQSYWEAITFNVVPIVTARRIYKNVVPPSSFIAMDDYKNADEMISYLNFLMENKEVYSRYFNYRNKGWMVLQKNDDYNVCNLCKKLIEHKRKGSYTKFKNINLWIHQYNNCSRKNYIPRYWKIIS
uniref:Fucosyltransferase n=1 Tax=Parastrongyloides trichosuri TaxID=131310 RepID=A0A0N4ZUY5_PARTI